MTFLQFHQIFTNLFIFTLIGDIIVSLLAKKNIISGKFCKGYLNITALLIVLPYVIYLLVISLASG